MARDKESIIPDYVSDICTIFGIPQEKAKELGLSEMLESVYDEALEYAHECEGM